MSGAGERSLSCRWHVLAIHLHDAPALQAAPARQDGAQRHHARLLPGGEDRRARLQRRGQVHAPSHHGGTRRGLPRRGDARARRDSRACSSRSPTWTSQRTSRATSKRRSPPRGRCSTASTSLPPTTPMTPPTSSPPFRRRSKPPTLGTSTRSSSTRWTLCGCPRPTPMSRHSPAASAAASHSAGCC